MNCKRCGKNVPVHSRVCPECGLSNPGYVPRTKEKTTSYSSYSARSTSQPKTAPNPGPTQAQQAADAAKSQGQSGAKPASAGSNSSLKNFLILAVVVIGIILLLKNCDTVRLKGTWEASDGTSITFLDKDSGYAYFPSTGTMDFTYFVEGDVMEVKTEGSLFAYPVVVRWEFEVKGRTLYITDMDSGLTEAFRKK